METKKYMDVAIYAGFSLLALIALLGFFLATARGSCVKRFFMPRLKNWSVASIAAAAAGVVIVLCVAVSPDSVFRLNSTGNATAMSMWISLLFSFYRFGLHDLLRMSRENAWRIHYTFGLLTISIATCHGILVFHRLGAHGVFHRLLAVFGLVGLICMLLGVLPALFLRYDHWKCMHAFCFIGLGFTLYHTVVAAFIHKTPVSIIQALLDVTVVLAYLAQKLYTHFSSTWAKVEKAEVVAEAEGAHLFLEMKIRGFSFQSGQWGRLLVPSISPIAHPFTLIPGRKDANVCICMKVGGRFTTQLAESCKAGAPPRMSLQGPYGCPCLPAQENQATVFVLGGVGVTPALSLAAGEAALGRKVALFWALRSEALLRYASNFLEPVVDEMSCVHLKGESSKVGACLPMQAQLRSEKLGAWLASLGKSYAAKGITRVTVFVCGPTSMAAEVRETMEVDSNVANWGLHIEEFHFLPQMLQKGAQPKQPATKIADVGDAAV